MPTLKLSLRPDVYDRHPSLLRPQQLLLRNELYLHSHTQSTTYLR